MAILMTISMLGLSWSFPFFVAKNLRISMSGGYVLHRMYLKGHNFTDFGWTAMYANSASRWAGTTSAYHLSLLTVLNEFWGIASASRTTE
jgi:hypothetical protein